MMSIHWDLTSKEGVAGLMDTSRTRDEWHENVRRVKAANRGRYPTFWFETVISSGLADRVAARWESGAGISVGYVAP